MAASHKEECEAKAHCGWSDDCGANNNGECPASAGQCRYDGTLGLCLPRRMGSSCRLKAGADAALERNCWDADISQCEPLLGQACELTTAGWLLASVKETETAGCIPDSWYDDQAHLAVALSGTVAVQQIRIVRDELWLVKTLDMWREVSGLGVPLVSANP